MSVTIEMSRRESRLDVSVVDGPPLLSYSVDERYRPHIHPLYVPGTDVAMTRFRPVDHPWQLGVFVGLNHVDGFDFWCNGEAVYPEETRGLFRHRQLEAHRQRGHEVAFSAVNDLVAPNGLIIGEETQAYSIAVPNEEVSCYTVDLTWTLRATGKPLHIGKYEYGGLAARLVGEMSTRRHLDSRGRRDDECLLGEAEWLSVAQPVDGMDGYVLGADDPNAYAYAGVAVFDHPSNAGYPTRWRVDGYGLINANIQNADIDVDLDEPVTYRYRLLAFRGAGDATALEAAYQDFLR